MATLIYRQLIFLGKKIFFIFCFTWTFKRFIFWNEIIIKRSRIFMSLYSTVQNSVHSLTNGYLSLLKEAYLLYILCVCFYLRTCDECIRDRLKINFIHNFHFRLFLMIFCLHLFIRKYVFFILHTHFHNSSCSKNIHYIINICCFLLFSLFLDVVKNLY